MRKMSNSNQPRRPINRTDGEDNAVGYNYDSITQAFSTLALANTLHQRTNYNVNAHGNRGAVRKTYRPQNNETNVHRSRGQGAAFNKRGGNRTVSVDRMINGPGEHARNSNRRGRSTPRSNGRNVPRGKNGECQLQRGDNLASSLTSLHTPEIDWFNMTTVPGGSVGAVKNGCWHALLTPNVVQKNSTKHDMHVDKRDSANSERVKRLKHREDIGFKRLLDMSEMGSEKLILILTKEEAGFEKLLKEKLQPDQLILILRIIKKACESALIQTVGRILAIVTDKSFLEQLIRYIQNINLQNSFEKRKNRYFWEDSESFWTNLIIFFEVLLRTKPNTACDILPNLLTATIMTVNYFHMVEENTKKKFEDIQEKLFLCMEEREKRENRDIMDDNVVIQEEPPDNFRDISLYPTVQEITTKEPSFIRSIIVEGKYASVEHYLDVQFRLLREDFVEPLREGICEYIHQLQDKKRKRINNVRIYPNVQFVNSLTDSGRLVRIVRFIQDPKKTKIKLENTKRFMFGSLVCFSDDVFANVIFGTICERKIDLLKQGLIGVELLESQSAFRYACNYTMVECNTYFEPYYQVLKALQMMDIEAFPMSKYIIQVNKEPVPPAYVTENSIMRFPVTNTHASFSSFQKHKAISVLDNYDWPTAALLGLDDSQYNAFQAALTREFCVIQGPPGTGKTYIGLRIAEILLYNRELWKTGPILVVCFTNHALDQFLEGIVTQKFTEKLVRVGGQSKNEILQPYNIKQKRMTRHRKGLADSVMLNQRFKVRRILSTIGQIQKMVHCIQDCDRIITIEQFFELPEFIKHRVLRSYDNEKFLEWLLGGFATKGNCKFPEAEKNTQNMDIVEIEPKQEDAAKSDSDESEIDIEDGEEERIIDDREIIDVSIEPNTVFNMTLLTIQKLRKENDELKLKFETLRHNQEIAGTSEVMFQSIEESVIIEQMNEAWEKLIYIEYRLNQYKNGNYPPPPNVQNYDDLDVLSSDERWGLYWKWVNALLKSLFHTLKELETEYFRVYRIYEELRVVDDIALMKTMDVIGMTTTGAARYQTILQSIKSPIVIVEEAAEILESHVVVSLTNSCQQLILIGDHKQLRPTTAVYHLAKKYNLEISLFERMVRNNIQCQTLEVQHRMRPEIARLIVPSIYPKLENHISVHSYPPVKGVNSNLFFVTHVKEETMINDTNTRMNVHEAQFVIRLALHFILQGYKPNEITVITTYSGQMFQMWKERKNFPQLKDVRITIVDNFQGEENKIILLSLVRSNPEGNIGFLKTDNRICVALSRAQEGLFIIGNMDILKKNSTIWAQINQELEEQNSVGTQLTLRCQVHPDQYTSVTVASDFNKISEGGCTMPCSFELNCGHICNRLCHIIDREHIHYFCKEPCTKILCDREHRCPDYCFIECRPCCVLIETKLKCGHTQHIPCSEDPEKFNCQEVVEVELDCTHIAPKPCYRNIDKFPCPHPCEIRKPCGHACEKRCHIHSDPDHLQDKCFKPCEKYKKDCSTKTHTCSLRCYEECTLCEVKVKKHRTVCPHVFDVECWRDVDSIVCEKPCRKKMDCGHNCLMKCFEPCGNCTKKVLKKHSICGHEILTECCKEPDRKKCFHKCPLNLPCGHPCQETCNKKCTEKCRVRVPSPIKAFCGHDIQIPCYLTNEVKSCASYTLLKYCREPCNELLKCQHKCAGSCGTCAQGRIHRSCQEKCNSSLICGHPCQTPCSQMCQPCKRKCTYSCKHSKCGNYCGEPCSECVEVCQRRCPHVRCPKNCGQMCVPDPCTKPCEKRLPCGHECIGFCNDPCPPVCRICDAEDETFDVFFGTEDEPDARFVYLEECGHTMEAEGMKQWLQISDGDKNEEINVKRCPRCKTVITKAHRYSNQIKAAFKAVNSVKKKLFGIDKENEIMRIQLLETVTALIASRLVTKSTRLTAFLTHTQESLQRVKRGKRQVLSKFEMNILKSQFEILQKIINIKEKYDIKKCYSINKYQEYRNFLIEIFTARNDRITVQEMQDFDIELLRFEKIMQVCHIETDPNFERALTSPAVKKLHDNMWSSLESAKKYSIEENKKLAHMLGDFIKLVNDSIKLRREEKQMIVAAMGMAKGHWFTCPNDHLYCITECGGAMEVSKCNECGAAIGGTNHTLLNTNRHNRDMDDSVHPAWSNATNLDLRNYEFLD